MDFKIVEEKENKLLGRIEIIFEVENAVKTPSRQELRKRIAALKNSKEELVSIDCIEQCFGEHRAKGKAFVYQDIEKLKRIEPKFLAQRETKKKKEKKEESAEKEKKTEEKKEEPVEEKGKEEPEEEKEKSKEKGGEKEKE